MRKNGLHRVTSSEMEEIEKEILKHPNMRVCRIKGKGSNYAYCFFDTIGEEFGIYKKYGYSHTIDGYLDYLEDMYIGEEDNIAWSVIVYNYSKAFNGWFFRESSKGEFEESMIRICDFYATGGISPSCGNTKHPYSFNVYLVD